MAFCVGERLHMLDATSFLAIEAFIYFELEMLESLCFSLPYKSLILSHTLS